MSSKNPDLQGELFEVCEDLTSAQGQINQAERVLVDDSGHQVELDEDAVGGLHCLLRSIEKDIEKARKKVERCAYCCDPD